MEKNRFTTLLDIKPHLRRGDNKIIAEMLADKYTLRTVNSQLSGQRTLKEPVLNAAIRIIESREVLLNSIQ